MHVSYVRGQSNDMQLAYAKSSMARFTRCHYFTPPCPNNILSMSTTDPGHWKKALVRSLKKSEGPLLDSITGKQVIQLQWEMSAMDKFVHGSGI